MPVSTIRLAAATLLLAAATATAASAAAGEEKSGRFTMTPTDGGYLKLDTETGAVSLCAKKDGGWACDVLPDSQQKLAKENEALRAEIKALKDDLKRMEDVIGLAEPKPGEGPPSESRPGGRDKLQLPSEKDVDKAFDYVEGMMKKLRERLKRLEEREKPGTPL